MDPKSALGGPKPIARTRRSLLKNRIHIKLDYRTTVLISGRQRKVWHLNIWTYHFYVKEAFSSLSAWNENPRPLLNRNIPLISGKYGLRNHFWPLKVFFSWGKVRKRALNQKAPVPDVQIFFGDSWGNFPKNGTNPRPGQFFWGF